MWQFNWGVFWAVLAATLPVGLLVAWIISGNIEVIHKYLSDIESKLVAVKDAIRPPPRIGD
jgi:hypothetical protein